MMIPLVLALAAMPLVPRGSAVAVDPRGTWVIDEETDAVVLLPPNGEKRRIAVGRWPERLAIDSRGRVFVSCREGGRVDVIAADFSVQSIAVGAEPSALYLDEAHHRLFVGLVTGRELALIDTQSLQVIARRPLELEPAALELTDDGLAVLARRGGEVAFVAPDFSTSLDWSVSLQPKGRERRSWQGVAMTLAGTDLLVVHTRVDTGLGEVGVGGLYGGGVSEEPITTAVSVLTRTRLMRTWEDLPLRDVTGVAVSGKLIAFASRGNGLVVLGSYSAGHEPPAVQTVDAGGGLLGVAFDGPTSVVSLAAFDRTLVRAGPAKKHMELPEARRVMKDVVARAQQATPEGKARNQQLILKIFGSSNLSTPGGGQLSGLSTGSLSNVFGPGAGSGGLGLGGLGSFNRFGSGVPPTPFTAWGDDLGLYVVRRTGLPKGRFDAELARGRRLFHATGNDGISHNSLGCVSCHPDGREDGLVWRLNGTRRQTPLLAGRLADTAPYNWKGTGDTLVSNIHQTTQRLGGDGLSPADERALARYLVEGLRPVHLPPVADPALVARGSQLFHDDQVGCATCHPSDDGFTDGALHDVDSLQRREGDELKEAGMKSDALARQFDAPDLRSLAITAPYFHDGSALSLETLLEENGDRMGHTRSLSTDERAALAAYLRSL